MIRVPIDDVPDDVASPQLDPTKWLDEVRCFRDEHGGWWMKVIRVVRDDPAPAEWTARAGWFCLAADSDFELALEPWLDNAVDGVE